MNINKYKYTMDISNTDSKFSNNILDIFDVGLHVHY